MRNDRSFLIALTSAALLAIGCTEFPMDVPYDGAQVLPFDTPESVLFDAERNVFYVSNIAGDSSEADGVGWIARLDADGAVTDPRWIEGLNAPKGMALFEGRLYVADLTEIVEIDVDASQVLRRVSAPGAVFLNDVASGNGSLWVSDTFGGAVYEFSPERSEASEFARDPLLATLNGLVVDGDRIVGGTIGDFMDPDDLGHLVAISRTGEVEIVRERIGKIDGLVRDGDGFLATDFRGLLLRIERDGSTTVVNDLVETQGLASAADLGFDPARRRVGVPDLFASRVVFFEVEAW